MQAAARVVEDSGVEVAAVAAVAAVAVMVVAAVTVVTVVVTATVEVPAVVATRVGAAAPHTVHSSCRRSTYCARNRARGNNRLPRAWSCSRAHRYLEASLVAMAATGLGCKSHRWSASSPARSSRTRRICHSHGRASCIVRSNHRTVMGTQTGRPRVGRSLACVLAASRCVVQSRSVGLYPAEVYDR